MHPDLKPLAKQGVPEGILTSSEFFPDTQRNVKEVLKALDKVEKHKGLAALDDFDHLQYLLYNNDHELLRGWYRQLHTRSQQAFKVLHLELSADEPEAFARLVLKREFEEIVDGFFVTEDERRMLPVFFGLIEERIFESWRDLRLEGKTAQEASALLPAELYSMTPVPEHDMLPLQAGIPFDSSIDLRSWVIKTWQHEIEKICARMALLAEERLVARVQELRSAPRDFLYVKSPRGRDLSEWSILGEELTFTAGFVGARVSSEVAAWFEPMFLIPIKDQTVSRIFDTARLLFSESPSMDLQDALHSALALESE